MLLVCTTTLSCSPLEVRLGILVHSPPVPFMVDSSRGWFRGEGDRTTNLLPKDLLLAVLAYRFQLMVEGEPMCLVAEGQKARPTEASIHKVRQSVQCSSMVLLDQQRQPRQLGLHDRSEKLYSHMFFFGQVPSCCYMLQHAVVLDVRRSHPQSAPAHDRASSSDCNNGVPFYRRALVCAISTCRRVRT